MLITPHGSIALPPPWPVRQGPFDGLGDDGGDQGEVVVLPLRFVVAPDHGRFHPASLPAATNGSLTVARGTLIGELRNGATRRAIRSPFRGQVDVWLVWEGQIVAPGQPLCSLRLPGGGAGAP
jgi:hypothetical protein